MNKELKAEIIRRFGAQYLFAAAMGIREATVSAVVRGHQILDDRTKRKWSDVLLCESEDIFPEGANNA